MLAKSWASDLWRVFLWHGYGSVASPLNPPDCSSVSIEDYEPLEKIAQSAIQEKQPFQRLDLDKDTLLKMFKYSPYKVHFIKDKIPDGGSTTVYRCGPLIDLCTGPHIPHTGKIKAFAVMKVSRLSTLLITELCSLLAWRLEKRSITADLRSQLPWQEANGGTQSASGWSGKTRSS